MNSLMQHYIMKLQIKQAIPNKRQLRMSRVKCKGLLIQTLWSLALLEAMERLLSFLKNKRMTLEKSKLHIQCSRS